jgi:hypothetical protein
MNRQDAKSTKQSNSPRLPPRSPRSLRFALNPNLHARQGRSNQIIATDGNNINRQDAKSAKENNPPRLPPRSSRPLRFALNPKSSLALLAVKSSSPSIVPEPPSRSHPARNPSPGPRPGAISPRIRFRDAVPSPPSQKHALGTPSRSLPAANRPSGRSFSQFRAIFDALSPKPTCPLAKRRPFPYPPITGRSLLSSHFASLPIPHTPPCHAFAHPVPMPDNSTSSAPPSRPPLLWGQSQITDIGG